MTAMQAVGLSGVELFCGVQAVGLQRGASIAYGFHT
jgi:hypothetical protein